MIPRYDGLVPAIRGPAPACAAASADETQSSTKRTVATTRVTRYTICPVDTVDTERAHVNAAQGGERRLFAFLPSVDCVTPPRELRVASQYFEDSMFASIAGSDADSGEDLDDNEESDTTTKHGNAREDGTHGVNSGNRKRRRARRREPMRLEYDGILTASSKEATKSARLVSTPASEYSHLSCVLLQLPTSWRQHDIEEDKGHGETACLSPLSTSKPLITSTPLRRPILQLWGERNTAAAGSNDGSPFPGNNATSISAAWGSDTPLRISKKDWKTMDAAEADLHKPTNWSDDDGGDVSDEGRGKSSKGADDTNSARARKREKEVATSVAVRSFLAGTREALRQQGSVGAANGLAPLQQVVGSDNVARVSAPVDTPAPVKTTEERAAVTMQLSPDSSGSKVRPSVAAAAMSIPTVLPTSALVTNSAASLPSSAGAPLDGSTSLDSLACSIVSKMQSSEARTTATLMELQKRILKQLPEFAAMSQKMKSPATKQDAIAWFQTSQQALRAWLVEHGHTINSDGVVTFGDV
ncbi:hypothetical protein, conserved [Leishmania tarentolae]|uniref:Uncharacterized protein n=1 Tax=Leishmania tarentolae TaxID=5689 RepID=A0A640KQ12_LEITA|nr:hypothetical protein, conserved [Leishmania tarentolae]